MILSVNRSNVTSEGRSNCCDVMVEDDDLDDFSHFVEVLDVYYISILVIVGIIGNTVAFVVFCLSPLRRLSLSVYLAAQAVSDTMFLLSLGVMWLDNPGVYLFHRNGWCQVTIFTSYVCSFLSVWLVACYTVERYIAICHPMSRRRMCTVKRARYVVVGLSTAAVGIYAFSLKMSGLVSDEHYTQCSPFLGDSYYSVHLVLTYWDFGAAFVLPFLAILSFNIRIFKELWRLTKQNSEHVPVASLHHCPDHYHRHPNSTYVCPKGQGQIKMTRLLLIISTSFLAVSLPSYVVRVRAFVANMIGGTTLISTTDLIIQQLCQYLFYLNYSINIILYLACWRRFRAVLFSCFNSTNSTVSASHTRRDTAGFR